jgi:NADH-quinone oxidoreductase subunit E
MATEGELANGVVISAFGRMLWRHGGEPGMLIPLLQAAQDSCGYIPPLAIEQIAMATGVPASEVYGVITFYRQFRLRPLGRYVIRACKGTACHVQGAEMICRTLEEELGIRQGETSEDSLFTFLEVACLGCCSLAPVVMIGDQAYGRLTPQGLRKVLRRFRGKPGGGA